jgi:hypothetical protein
MSAGIVSFSQSKNQLPNKQLKLNWYTRVEQTAKLAGIPMLEEFLCRKTTSIRVKDGLGSLKDLTAKIAFITLEEFLESVSSSGAEEFTWDRWEIEAKAASLAKSLSISTEFHPREIINFYEDVSRHLSRRPADSQEFWHILLLITKNRYDSKIMSSNQAARELNKIFKGLNHDYSASLDRISVLEAAVNHTTEIFGGIPESFASRFESASEVVELYDQACTKNFELENELVLISTDLAINEAMISELSSDISKLQPSNNDHRSLELQGALNNVDLAKQILVNLNDSNNELGLTIEMKEKAILSLKALNRRLTSLVRDKSKIVRHLEHSRSLSRALAKRLAGMARGHKMADVSAQTELKDQRSLHEKLKTETRSFRSITILCTAGIVLFFSFSLALIFQIVPL